MQTAQLRAKARSFAEHTIQVFERMCGNIVTSNEVVTDAGWLMPHAGGLQREKKTQKVMHNDEVFIHR